MLEHRNKDAMNGKTTQSNVNAYEKKLREILEQFS